MAERRIQAFKLKSRMMHLVTMLFSLPGCLVVAVILLGATTVPEMPPDPTLIGCVDDSARACPPSFSASNQVSPPDAEASDLCESYSMRIIFRITPTYSNTPQVEKVWTLTRGTSAESRKQSLYDAWGRHQCTQDLCFPEWIIKVLFVRYM